MTGPDEPDDELDVDEQEREMARWNAYVLARAAEKEQAAKERRQRRERESRERRRQMAVYKRLTGG